MAGSIVIPNAFQTQSGPIPLSQLDNNFATLSGSANNLATYSNYYVDSSGAANTITVAVALPQTFAYSAGVELNVKLSNTNTSATVNINVNSLGNQAVLNGDGTQVLIGQLVAGQILKMIYSGSTFLLAGPQSKTSTGIAPFTATPAGNVTLPAPSSGVSLTVVGSAGGSLANFIVPVNSSGGLVVTGSGTGDAQVVSTVTGFASIAMSVNNSGSADSNGVPTGSVGIGTPQGVPFVLTTASNPRLNVAASGQITVNGVTTGNALSVSQLSNTTGIQVNSSNGVNAGVSLNQTSVVTWQMYNQAGTGNLNFNNGSVDTIKIAPSGSVTINPTNTGTTLSVTGIAGAFGSNEAAIFTAPNTNGQSNGVRIIAGTSAGDVNLALTNAANTANLWLFDGAGGMASSGLTSQGAGTINASGYYTNGNSILSIVQNNQPNNYTLVGSDPGKHIYHSSTSAHTYTIPANSSVPFPIGTAVTFVNPNAGGVLSIAITSDTMFLSGQAGTSGTRTLTSVGVATAIKVAATVWVISGSNLI